MQPGGLATVATSGLYADLGSKPTLGTAAAQDATAFATSTQGGLADSAVQPGDAVSDLAETSTAKIMTDVERSKLSGIATGATANAADATLLARGNHTGTQIASTISDLAAAVAATASVTANTAKVSNATHTGDVTGATVLTIANDAVSNAKLANVATSTIKGRVTAATGDPEDLSAAQVRTLLNVEDGATAGGGTPATAAQIQALTGTSAIVPANVATALSSASPSGGSNYAMDWSATICAAWVVTANRVLSNPTNVVAGTTRVVTITANNTTERTITFGTNFKGTLPTVKVKSTAAVTLFLYAVSSTQILVSDKAWTP